MDCNDLSFLKTMFQCEVKEIPYQLIIVNQSKTSVLNSDFSNIKVVNDTSFGLSRSRNMAIKEATASICWILDDDCIVEENAVEKIINAHNTYTHSIITLQTVLKSGKLFRFYQEVDNTLSRKQIKKVLSPEITFKREEVLKKGIQFDLRFGLGAQFGDSENYVFLTDAFDKAISIQFVKESIVKHEAQTSSDDVSSNRVIYTRGALAARDNLGTAQIKQCKYAFFLWRKGYVKGFFNLYHKYKVFDHGINDYLTGFKDRYMEHPDL